MRLIFIVRIQLICNAESLCLSTLLAETTTKFKVINAAMLLENLFPLNYVVLLFLPM